MLSSAPAFAQPKGAGGFFPDPSSLFAADIALNRLSREKGWWAAMRDRAAKQATLAVPERVLALPWLKGRKEAPSVSVRSAARAYVSCDGRTGVTTGVWQGQNGDQGYYTMIWQRSRKGEWEWLFDHQDRLIAPRETQEALIGKVASCKALLRPPAPDGDGASKPKMPPQARSRSGDKGDGSPPPDRSLLWDVVTGQDGSRDVRVSLWNGSGYDVVIDDKVGAEQ